MAQSDGKDRTASHMLSIQITLRVVNVQSHQAVLKMSVSRDIFVIK